MRHLLVALTMAALAMPGCGGNTGKNEGDPCADIDGDGYGLGAGCAGDDCDESDATCWVGDCCPTVDEECIDHDGDGYSNTVQGGLSVRAVDGQFGGGNQVFDNISFDGTLPSDQGGDDLEVVHDYGVVYYDNPYDYFDLADYNLFWRSDGNPVMVGGNEGALFGGGPITFAQWQADLAAADIPATAMQANSIEADPEFEDMQNHNFQLADNGQVALTASSTGGPVGCYITGDEEIGLRADPTC